MEALFLVVTMTGTAEMIAEDVIEAHGAGHEFALRLAEHVEPSILTQTRRLLVISSTYGTGEVPTPGKAFFDALSKKPMDLSHLKYGIIALGDTIYSDTFANGGRQWDLLLAECGAQRLADTLLLDASGQDDMSDLAVEWARGWLESALQAEEADVRSPAPSKA